MTPPTAAPIVAMLLGLIATLASAAEPTNYTTPQLWPANLADTWTATDNLGRRVPEPGVAPAPRANRYVGMFYFIWLGAHGYDRNKGSPNEGVLPPTASDTASPYDITQLLAANPNAAAFGPPGAFHHWGEPYFGYYVSNDTWVIRRHAQLLADAGVDVLFFDATNARAYLPTVLTIAQEFAALRAQGRSTPSISFLLHSGTPKVAAKLFTEFYAKNLHRDLWFFWKGKPLILANPAELTASQRDFFSVRESWAWTKGKPGAWFADGRDKWPWIDHTPQSFGWHESSARPEQVAVAAAQHPIANIGRSHQAGKQPPPGQEQSDRGLFFTEQWEHALSVDPEFVFVTGWNEWVAMRFTDGKSKFMLGRPIKKGETYFVDAYNAEFSRDLEPMRGGFGDNYYLQLVAQIRRFKGARPPPVTTTSSAMTIDGDFKDWAAITATYHDDIGDISPRDHHGWGRIPRYENRTGRHDLTTAKIACDTTHVFFCLETAAPLAATTLPTGLTLWLKTARGEFAINRAGQIPLLERQSAPHIWQSLGAARVAVADNRVELALPRSLIGLGESLAFSLDFKWTDACDFEADPMHAYDQGDAAPNGRFYYHFTFRP